METEEDNFGGGNLVTASKKANLKMVFIHSFECKFVRKHRFFAHPTTKNE